MKNVLHLADYSYQVKRRRHRNEDIRITGYLCSRFRVALCHPARYEASIGVSSKVMRKG